jgi:hypothetical protein
MNENDKKAEVTINFSQIGRWIHSNVLWTATIALGFAAWQITGILWNMPSEAWKCGDSPKAIIGVLGFIVATAAFVIVGANALIDSYTKSKRIR